jgi:hypothetical protein
VEADAVVAADPEARIVSVAAASTASTLRVLDPRDVGRSAITDLRTSGRTIVTKHTSVCAVSLVEGARRQRY